MKSTQGGNKSTLKKRKSLLRSFPIHRLFVCLFLSLDLTLIYFLYRSDTHFFTNKYQFVDVLKLLTSFPILLVFCFVFDLICFLYFLSCFNVDDSQVIQRIKNQKSKSRSKFAFISFQKKHKKWQRIRQLLSFKDSQFVFLFLLFPVWVFLHR